MVEPFIIKASKALSLLFSCNNGNKQGYQPRIEADYNQQKWTEELYEPYEELVNQATQPYETVDADGKRTIHIYLDCGAIHVGSNCHVLIYGEMDSSHFFDYYNYDKFPDLSYMVDEFYAALGTESFESKFFHLFAIIEHIEREYLWLSDTELLYDEKDIDLVSDCLKGQLQMPKEKKERLWSSINGMMRKSTKLGRESKLVNILQHMGICELTKCGMKKEINKDTIKLLTSMRNTAFHGGRKNSEDEQKSAITTETAVAMLMEICEGIIIYVAKKIYIKN
jgi:hypothetical protein